MKKHFTFRWLLRVHLSLLFPFVASLSSNPLFAQTATWVGNVSKSYADANNWNPTTFNPMDASSTTITIGAGSPNNPTHTGDNSNPVTRRPSRLNTTIDAYLTVAGKLYPNNSDVLNGTIDIIAGGDFNVRNVAFVGNGGKGTVTVLAGGTFTSKNAMYVGRNAGGNGVLNVWGGAVYATDIQVATNTATGLINFKTVSGTITVTGDKKSYFEGLVTAGKMTIESGRTFSIVYNATANTTVVSVYQDPNSLLKEQGNNVILENSTVRATIAKNSGQIVSCLYNGVEMVSTSGNKTQVYYDWTSSYGFEQLYGCNFTVKKLNDSIVDVSFKRVFTPSIGHVTPADMDIHYVLKRNDTGLYTYSILEHQPNYPKVDLGSWRMVWWIANNGTVNTCEKMYVDSLRNWEMPSPYDYANGEATGIPEIIKLKTGVRAEKYDGKYQYSKQLWEQDVVGHASDKNKVGIWFVYGSHEFVNDGPTYSDLNGAAGILHAILNGVHYNASGFEIPEGAYWRKIYGPFLVYFNNKNTGDEAWADAQARVAKEKQQWPYAWLDNVEEYPLKEVRGTITGKLTIKDPYKATLHGGNAWVGVTQLSSDNTQKNWQFESKNYHYWVKTDANGNFSIPNVRAGTYTFYALKAGAVGEYSKENITVEAGKTTAIGEQLWQIPRKNGNLAWEIGFPDRLAKEYKNGDFAYCEGFIWNKIASQYTNPIEYNVVDKNWQNVLNYAHSPYLDASGGMQVWKWRINFTLPANLPSTGNATLTIAYASADHARQQLYLNDDTKEFTAFYPLISEGNAYVRQDNHAKYTVSTVSIPLSRLVAGKNTLTLSMPSTQAIANHLMYDYISLEIPGLTKARFTNNPTNADANTSINFDATASTTAEGTSLMYDWDFGDGTKGTGKTTQHRFAAGTYQVKLIVTDTFGAKDTTATSLTIAAVNNKPVAKFTSNVKQGYAPLQVLFDASSSSDPDKDALSYNWTLGDGTTAQGINASYTYANAGTYTVRLTVKDSKGAADTTSTQINVVLVTGTQDEKQRDVATITAYPNPVVGTQLLVQIDLAQASEVGITLVDATGKTWLARPANRYATGKSVVLLDISPLPRGLYFMHVTIGQTTSVLKLQRE